MAYRFRMLSLRAKRSNLGRACQVAEIASSRFALLAMTPWD